MKYNKLGIISGFLVFLVLTGFVVAYPVQLRLQSNLVGFNTFLAYCTDDSCLEYTANGTSTLNTGTNLNVYAITGSGDTFWTELDYVDGYLPHLYRYAAYDSTDTGPFTKEVIFSKKAACEANINNVSLSSGIVSESNELSVTANVQSAINFPFPSLRSVKIPQNLKDFYSSLTNVTFKVKDSNGNVVHTQKQSTEPWVGSNETLTFKFTPTVQGNYNVVLETEVTDVFCTSTNKKTSTVALTVTDSPPVANAGQDKTVDQGQAVSFDASGTVSADSVILYLWNFGDGFSETGKQVSHTYQNPGTFTVTLKVVDSDGQESTDTATVTVNQVVQDNTPTVNFEAAPSSSVEGQLVQFTDKSVSLDGFKSRLWDFGDQTTSTETNPTHAFQQQGTFVVKLTVVDNDDDSVSKTANFVVTDSEPVAGFSFGLAVKGTPVQFTDASTAFDGVQSRLWDFGDGSNSFDQNPAHTFANSGTFNVKLTVTDSDGSSASATKQVTVTETPVPVITDLQAPSQAFVGSATQFTVQATSSKALTTFEWDFDYDGTFNPAPTLFNLSTVSFTFDQEKTFRVAVRVIDSDGLISSVAEKSILVKTSDKDIAVSAPTQSKSDSTVYLFDSVAVKSNISNLGSSAENVTVNLREGLVVRDSKTVSLDVGETKEVTFTWNPSIKGFRSLTVEAQQLQGEVKVSNNLQTLQNIKVESVEDSLSLNFVHSSKFPSATEPKNSEFFIWVKVENKGKSELKDVKLTLNTSLSVTDASDGQPSKEKLLALSVGEKRDFWWKVESGIGKTFNPKVFIGDINDRIEVTRTIVVQ